MANFACFLQALHRLYSCIQKGVNSLSNSVRTIATCCFHFFLYRVPSFWIQLLYFLFISTLGFSVLASLKPRTESFRPRNLDMFFTSVSAVTVSSMSTVEMEVFSNTQLIILTILMLIGGEVFTSLIALQLRKYKLKSLWKGEEKIVSIPTFPSKPPSNHDEHTIINNIELGLMGRTLSHESLKPELVESNDNELLKYCSIKHLGYVVLAYFLGVQIIGLTFVSTYVAFSKSVKNILSQKGLETSTFSIFTTISTFSSCGFIPTNENMVVFRKNSGLLIILIPQVLLGNTFFPVCLRFLIWFTGKFFKREESRFLLTNTHEINFLHLLPGLHSSLLVTTLFGFILVQFLLFCSMDWNSEALSGMSSFEKVVGVLFQTVNSRHAGESVVDITKISQALVVLYVVMMYLPPYTSYHPVKNEQQCGKKKKRRGGVIVENVVFSQLAYLVISIIFVCITERDKMNEDPLNFNVFNVVVEVISAYGNVGFSTGYSCNKQIHPHNICVDKTYGFSGRWSDQGKFILIVVMFFGRLKRFNTDRHRPWKLL